LVEPHDGIPSSDDLGYYPEGIPSSNDLGYPRRRRKSYSAQQGPYPPAQYPQQYPQPYPQMMVAPKSPGVAVLASFFIPGLGSMISGRGGRGALILCLYVLSWLLTVALVGFVGVFCCWIWGMVQGHADAVAWNRSHGIIS
jgi:TM2 domain-containing membrane protein YozV